MAEKKLNKKLPESGVFPEQTRMRKYSIGAVGFAVILKNDLGGDDWFRVELIGPVRARMLRDARDGKKLPHNMQLLGEGNGGIQLIKKEQVDWEGMGPE